MRKPWLAALALTLAMVSPVLAQDTQPQRATLVGLTGVYVLIESIKPDAEREGLERSTIQTDVELKLRQAGIRVLTKTEYFDAPGTPFLYLWVYLVKSESIPGLYAYSISLSLNQTVRLGRNPKIEADAATWRARGGVGIVGASRLSSVREDVRDQVDQFINAYLAANPKR